MKHWLAVALFLLGLGFGLGLGAALGAARAQAGVQDELDAALAELLDCSVTAGWLQAPGPDGKLYWVPVTAQEQRGMAEDAMREGHKRKAGQLHESPAPR